MNDYESRMETTRIEIKWYAYLSWPCPIEKISIKYIIRKLSLDNVHEICFIRRYP